MYFVVFSKSPYLLARLCVLLQMVLEFNLTFTTNDADDWERQKYLVVNRETKQIYFIGHHGCNNPTRFTLTESNYTKVLSTIIDNKK